MEPASGRRVELRTPVSEGDHVRGTREARITLVEYGAFDCEASAESYPLVRSLLERFAVDLRFVFRHSPRGTGQTRGRRAALAAEAAALQDRFWAMHDLLFERMPAFEPQDLGVYARELGLDEERLFRDMRTAAVSRRVRENELGALKSGVRETPAFFLNEERWTGAFELDALGQAIRALRRELGGSARVRRRDGSGHLDPSYRAALLRESGQQAGDAERAFVNGQSSDDGLAEELGEEFVAAATLGQYEGDAFNQVVPEESGGPFVETSAGTEFAGGTDESNIEEATREPFPTT